MENVTIKGTTGTNDGMTLINAFKIADSNKRFVILTKFEQVGEGVNKIYLSEFVENNPGVLSLVGIKGDDIWDKVKNVMKQIVEKTNSIKVYSEMENVKKCSIEATSDFDNSRKIIGVKSSSITVDDSGVCPLGRQDSFEVEEKPAELDEISALDALSNVTETMDFDIPSVEPVTSLEPQVNLLESTPSVEPIPNPIDPVSEPISVPNTPVSTPEPAAPKFVIPEAVVNDTIASAPVDVAPTNDLETLIPEKKEEVVPEVVAEEPVMLDIQMPVMDEEIKAEEPTGIDNKLFTNAPEEQLEVKLPEVSAGEGSTNEQVDNSKLEEAINAKIEELKSTLLKHIEEDITQYKNEINKLLNPSEEVTTTAATSNGVEEVETVKTLEENVMNDALSQIQNMIIPE